MMLNMETWLIALIPVLILAVFPFMAYLTGRLARGKGHSFWLWFVIGFILGPVGILIAYFIAPAERNTATV